MWLKEYGKAKARLLRPLGYEPPRNTDPASNGEYRLLEWLAARGERYGNNSIIDVGANMGDWTAAARERLKPAGIEKFLCIEPVPHFAQAVRNRFAGNSDVTCHEVAFSNSSGGFAEIKSIGGGARFTGSNSVSANSGSNKAVAVHRVALLTGDDFVAAEKIKPFFVKIDCDGHDLSVLRGLAQTLKDVRPILQFEYCDFWAVENVRLAEACRFLANFGYATFKLFPDRIERFHFNFLFETYGYQNIVASPAEFAAFSKKSIAFGAPR